MTVVERVAREIATADAEPNVERFWVTYIPQARAAIAALREPSEGMCKAGNEALAPWVTPALHSGQAWRFMVDTALAEDAG